MVNMSPPSARDVGSIPGWGTKIPHTSWPKKITKNIRQKQYGNKFNKDFDKNIVYKRFINK